MGWAQEVIKRSRRVEYYSARSEGTAKADGRVELKAKAAQYEGNGANKEEEDKLVVDGNGVKKRSIRDLFSHELKPTDFSCGCGHPVFDELRVQEDNGDWDVRFKYNPEGSLEDAIDKKDDDESKSRVYATDENKKKALDKLSLVSLEDVGNKADQETLDRYKRGPRDCYESYIKKKGSSEEMDWPVPYLVRRINLKNGKVNEEKWIENRFGSSSAMNNRSYSVRHENHEGEMVVTDVIPDYVHGNEIGDVKDVKSQSFTNQLRAMRTLAEENSKNFSIIVRNTEHPEGQTNLSGPLSSAADSIYRDINE